MQNLSNKGKVERQFDRMLQSNNLSVSTTKDLSGYTGHDTTYLILLYFRVSPTFRFSISPLSSSPNFAFSSMYFRWWLFPFCSNKVFYMLIMDETRTKRLKFSKDTFRFFFFGSMECFKGRKYRITSLTVINFSKS